jgi:putative transposase
MRDPHGVPFTRSQPERLLPMSPGATSAAQRTEARHRESRGAHAHVPSPDLLERDFTADGPNKKWLCDITYIPTDEGFLYLAGVMDAWSRSIVGWSMSNTLHATIAIDALTMAVKRISRAWQLL